MTWLGDGHRGAYRCSVGRVWCVGRSQVYTGVLQGSYWIFKGWSKGVLKDVFKGLSGFANPCTQEVYVGVSVSPPMKLSTETRSPNPGEEVCRFCRLSQTQRPLMRI